MKGHALTGGCAKPVPQKESYICIAPELGQSVYNYFNSALSEKEARQFEEHLLLCFQCQDIIFALDRLVETIRQNRDELFQVEKPATQDDKTMKVNRGACE
jgi:hypothetical protein